MTYKAIGLDHSLTNTGVAFVVTDGNKILNYSTHTIKTTSKEPIEQRVSFIATGVRKLIASSTIGVCAFDDLGIENVSRGSKFRREEMGMSFAAALIGSYSFVRKGSASVTLVTPQQHKVMLCPNWHGTNKVNWEKMGRTGKFKRSMPDKISTMSALYATHKIKVTNDHESDAAAIAIYVAIKNGGLKI